MVFVGGGGRRPEAEGWVGEGCGGGGGRGTLLGQGMIGGHEGEGREGC